MMRMKKGLYIQTRRHFELVRSQSEMVLVNQSSAPPDSADYLSRHRVLAVCTQCSQDINFKDSPRMYYGTNARGLPLRSLSRIAYHRLGE